MKTPGVIALGIATFSGGLFIGLLAGRNVAPASRDDFNVRPPQAHRENTISDGSAQANLNPGGDEEALGVALLSKRIQELEAEIQLLRQGRTTIQEGPDKLTIAANIYEGYVEVRSSMHPDREKFLELVSLFKELDESTASYFIKKYGESRGLKGKFNEQSIAIELTMRSGGPEAATFLNALLHDQSLKSAHRANLLRDISGIGGGAFSIKRVPVRDELLATALDFVRSNKAKERSAGAGLLGGAANENSRSELIRLVEEDSHLEVKAAATLSLRYVGDASTLDYLSSYWITKAQDFTGHDGAQFRKALQSTINRLAAVHR